jgi:preprotein translocase subunit Sec63
MPPTKKTAKKKSASKLTPAALIPEQLAPLVIRLRRENVILDSDIAELYGVETKALNRAVKKKYREISCRFHVPTH